MEAEAIEMGKAGYRVGVFFAVLFYIFGIVSFLVAYATDSFAPFYGALFWFVFGIIVNAIAHHVRPRKRIDAYGYYRDRRHITGMSN